MAFEIKRKAELALVALLGERLTDLNFYPSKGGDDDGGTTLPRPPFGAIWIENAEKTMAQQKTYMLSGVVVWVTRAGTTDVSDETDTVKQIYDAMILIDQLIRVGESADPTHSLIIHGLDISMVDEFSDPERLAHGDTISFTMGASEFD